MELGGDVTQKQLKYVAFRRLKNFSRVAVHPQKASLLLYLLVDSDVLAHEVGFTRETRRSGTSRRVNARYESGTYMTLREPSR